MAQYRRSEPNETGAEMDEAILNHESREDEEDVEAEEETLDSVQKKLRKTRKKFASAHVTREQYAIKRLATRAAKQQALAAQMDEADLPIDQMQSLQDQQTRQYSLDADSDAKMVTLAKKRTITQAKEIQVLLDKISEMQEEQEMEQEMMKKFTDVPDHLKRSPRAPASYEIKNTKKPKDATVSSPGEIRRQYAFMKGFNNISPNANATEGEKKMYEMGQFERGDKNDSAAPARAAPAPVYVVDDEARDDPSLATRLREDVPKNKPAELLNKTKPPVYDEINANKAIATMKQILHDTLASGVRMNRVYKFMAMQLRDSALDNRARIKIAGLYGHVENIDEFEQALKDNGAILFVLTMITHADSGLFTAVFEHGEIQKKMQTNGSGYPKNRAHKIHWMWQNIFSGSSNTAVAFFTSKATGPKYVPVVEQSRGSLGDGPENLYQGDPEDGNFNLNPDDFKNKGELRSGDDNGDHFLINHDWMGGGSDEQRPPSVRRSSRSPVDGPHIDQSPSARSPSVRRSSRSPVDGQPIDQRPPERYPSVRRSSRSPVDGLLIDQSPSARSGSRRSSSPGPERYPSRPGSDSPQRPPSRPASASAQRPPSRPASASPQRPPSRPASASAQRPPSRPGSASAQRPPSRPASAPIAPLWDDGAHFERNQNIAKVEHDRIVKKVNTMWPGSNFEANLWVLLKKLTEYTHEQVHMIRREDDNYGDEVVLNNIANAARVITESLKSNTGFVKMIENKPAANYCALLMLCRSVMSMIDGFPEQRKRMRNDMQYVTYVMDAGQAVVNMLEGPGVRPVNSKFTIGSGRLADLVNSTTHYTLERIDEL